MDSEKFIEKVLDVFDRESLDLYILRTYNEKDILRLLESIDDYFKSTMIDFVKVYYPFSVMDAIRSEEIEREK